MVFILYKLINKPKKRTVLPVQFSCLFLLFFFICTTFCETRLTNDIHYSGEPDLDVLGNKNVLVWEDYRFGNDEIMIKISEDSGKTWGADQRLTSADSASWRPKVRIGDSGRIHTVWEDLRTGTRQVFYKEYDGSSWSWDIKVSNNTPYAAFPSLAVIGNDVYICWEDYRDGNDEIYLRKRVGGIWSSEMRLTRHDSTSWGSSIAAGPDKSLHVTWFDFRTGSDEIYYINSADDGESWSTPVNISNDPKNCWEPRIAAGSSGTVHVVWYAFRDALNSYEIFYNRNTGSGWKKPVMLSDAGSDSKCPSIDADADNVLVAWEDFRDLNDEIYCTVSEDQGSKWNGNIRITNHAGDSFGASAKIKNKHVNIAWFDYRDGNDEIYFFRALDNALEILPAALFKSSSLSCYPNPFIRYLTVIMPDCAGGERQINIFDPRGRRIYSTSQIQRRVNIVWSRELAAGPYLVEYRETNRNNYIIVNHIK
jgi:hypothetical protein